MNTQRPPNIVICMCDQLRAHAVGCYGDPVARTPNIDRLAREGVRFNHAVSPNPVCMPARTSILAGQYTRTCAPELGNAIQQFEDGTWGMAEYPDETRTALPDQAEANAVATELESRLRTWHEQTPWFADRTSLPERNTP